MADPVIELKNVTVELGEEVILKEINLQVFPMETIVLIGPSGGGKTVLLKTMAGLFEPKQGTVSCYGVKWSDLSLAGRHDLARHVGVQFQKGALFDDMSAFENVAYPLREHTKMTEGEVSLRVMECLKAVRLEKAAELEAHEMSGGMRLRLGIARAIALKPEILFMDDPTAGLDPVNSDEIAQMIIDLKKQISATLIVVTHDISRAYQFAGRIFLVAQQQVIETGSAEETQKHTDPRVQQFLHGWQKGPLTMNGGY